MGGLTSKTFKPGGKDDKTEATQVGKQTSAVNIEYRDKSYQLARETQSAYYYGNKNGVAEGAGKSDAVQKRLVLQSASGSDHTLFRRVRETPTAIYYEPNDEDDTEEMNDSNKPKGKETKNIVLENTQAVEKRIKVIRDGSSDIKIRPESITIQKHDMIVDHTVRKKPRGDVLNTHSVMVRSKETNAVPTANIALDDEAGLTAIEEGKERESQLLRDEVNEKQSELQTKEQEISVDTKRLAEGNDKDKVTGTLEPTAEKELKVVSVNKSEEALADSVKDKDVDDDMKQKRESITKTTKYLNSNNEPQLDNKEILDSSTVLDNDTKKTGKILPVSGQEDANSASQTTVTGESSLDNDSAKADDSNEKNKQHEATNSKHDSVITDKDTGIAVVRDVDDNDK